MPDILIADDERILRDLVAHDLTERGMTVRTAGDGEETIKEIGKREPDLLLLDILMPNTDGYAVLKHIRSNGYDFPVFMLSNLSGAFEEEKCMALGATGYFVKSRIDAGDLWEKISTRLRPRNVD